MRMARLGVPSEYCRTAALFTHFLDFVNPLSGAAVMEEDGVAAGVSSGPSPDAKGALNHQQQQQQQQQRR
jgi:hypothetical protein